MIDWKMETESARCDAFDAEFPYWQEGEEESDSERFVSEFDYFHPQHDDIRASEFHIQNHN